MTATSHGFELRGEATPLRRLIADVWRSRGLLRMLARRDFYVRYRRPSFGLLWVVGLPLVQAVVLSVVFSRIVRIETGVSYPVFVLAGVLPWTFLTGSLVQGSTAISAGASIATKVYFPRAILPLVLVGANLYGFLPTIPILIGVSLLFGVEVWPHVLLLIPAIVLMVALISGFNLVLSALHVYFRDIGFIVQAATTPWFYGSAVIFPITRVPEGPLRWLMEINPATGMVQVFRAAVIGPDRAPVSAVGWTVGWTIALLVAAMLLHRRFDRVFVDRL